MKRLEPLTIDTAPEASRATLEAIQSRFGFVPNVLATFAHSPALLSGYVALDAAFQKTSFTPTERQLILLTVSMENGCHYCMASHTTTLKKLKASQEMIDAVRQGAPLEDPKADALVATTRELTRERGALSEQLQEQFLRVGYSEVALLEILMGVAQKVMSNYLEHFNPVVIDMAFRGER